jgi:hypothetical protein
LNQRRIWTTREGRKFEFVLRGSREKHHRYFGKLLQRISSLPLHFLVGCDIFITVKRLGAPLTQAFGTLTPPWAEIAISGGGM